MMCVRATGSLPSSRLSGSGAMLGSAISATILNIAAFGRLARRCRSRALSRVFCAARMATTAPFGIAGLSSRP